MSDSHAKNAIYAAKRKYEVKFDASTSTHKRNLLFVAVLAGFSILVTPPENELYKINLGVISGEIKQPIIIYTGLLLITLYQVYYFWLICRTAIIDSVNLTQIEKVFMYELATLKAFDYWCSLCRKTTPRGWNSAINGFVESPNRSIENNWNVRAQTEVSHLEEQPTLLKTIKTDENFELHEVRGHYLLDFIYKPQPEDYMYLHQHREYFWLTKKKEFVEYVLPLIAGYVAILGLIIKICTLITNPDMWLPSPI